MMRIITILAALTMATVSGAQGQIPQQQIGTQTDVPVSIEDGNYVINLRDVEVRALSEQVSQITGRTLILDPSVRGQVTVISSEPLDEDGVWELYRSVLRVNGYAALASGGNWRIVPQNNAAQGGAPVYQGGELRSQDMVTRLVRLRNLPADSATSVLSPLVASYGSLEAVGQPNAIIITDYAENVRRIESLALMLDRGQGDSFATIALNFASAAQVAETLGRLIGTENGGLGPRIAVDERSNSLILRGEPEMISNIRNLVSSLDKPGGTVPMTRVFRLKNSDAEVVAEIIRGILGGQGQANNPVSRSLSSDRIGAGPTGSASRGNGYSDTANRILGLQNNQPNRQQANGARAGTTSENGAIASSGAMAGDVAIQPSTDLNAIVVRGSPAAIAEIDSLITELDVRRPQVMIEAAIVEITGDTAEQLGIQLGFGEDLPQGGFAATSFSPLGRSLRSILTTLGEPAAIGLIEDGLSAGYSSSDGYGVLLQALANSTRANLLSTPSLTTLDNQPAEIVVGQNVPFRTGSFTTSGNSTNPFTTIERQDVGITLRVVPRVHQGDVVRLEVSQEVSSLVNSNVIGAADLITNRRSIRTTVLADNNETIVLGGLISDDRQYADNKVPIAGDLPIIGSLFGAERESLSKRTLFVFLRPTILRDAGDVVAAAESRYEQIRREDQRFGDDEQLLLRQTAPKLPLELDGVY